MIKKIYGNWHSSFLSDVQITNQQPVATAMSGFSGTGGHWSLFLENRRQINPVPGGVYVRTRAPAGNWGEVKVGGTMSTSHAMPDEAAIRVTGAFPLRFETVWA